VGLQLRLGQRDQRVRGVVVLGVLGRLGADDVPAALQRTDVLVAALLMWCVDAVADKIPYVDSTWDTVHTAIRPTIGAIVAALIAGDQGTLGQATAAAVGGGTALASHLVKAGIRLGVNTSPEPASNIVVSTGEDLTVAGVVALSLLHPVAAAHRGGAAGVGIGLVALLVGRIRPSARRRDARTQGGAERRAHCDGPDIGGLPDQGAYTPRMGDTATCAADTRPCPAATGRRRASAVAPAGGARRRRRPRPDRLPAAGRRGAARATSLRVLLAAAAVVTPPTRGAGRRRP
jgi:hypothetical protein